jgi:hypothetical protein
LPENRVLRRTFRTKVNEVRRIWKKKLHSEELHEVLDFRHGGVEIFDLLTSHET